MLPSNVLASGHSKCLQVPPGASKRGTTVILKLKPNCECCDKDLAPDAADALICSFECTFCADCAATRLPSGRCPNCGGELVRRPARPAAMLAKYPASTERVTKPHPGCGKAA